MENFGGRESRDTHYKFRVMRRYVASGSITLKMCKCRSRSMYFFVKAREVGNREVEVIHEDIVRILKTRLTT